MSSGSRWPQLLKLLVVTLAVAVGWIVWRLLRGMAAVTGSLGSNRESVVVASEPLHEVPGPGDGRWFQSRDLDAFLNADGGGLASFMLVWGETCVVWKRGVGVATGRLAGRRKRREPVTNEHVRLHAEPQEGAMAAALARLSRHPAPDVLVETAAEILRAALEVHGDTLA